MQNYTCSIIPHLPTGTHVLPSPARFSFPIRLAGKRLQTCKKKAMDGPDKRLPRGLSKRWFYIHEIIFYFVRGKLDVEDGRLYEGLQASRSRRQIQVSFGHPVVLPVIRMNMPYRGYSADGRDA